MEEKDVLLLLLMIFLHIVIFILSTLKMNYMINLKYTKFWRRKAKLLLMMPFSTGTGVERVGVVGPDPD